MLRQLSDTSPYPVWLARVAETLTAPPPPPQEPLLDWGFTPAAAALGDTGRRRRRCGT